MLRTLRGAGAIAATLAAASLLHAANTGSQADRLLNELRIASHSARSDADRLAIMSPRVSWMTAAGLLDNVKGDINSMGSTLMRLESLRNEVEPLQLKQIDTAGTLLQEMASSTTGAIETLDKNQENYSSVAAYERHAGDLSASSQQLSHSLDEYFALAKARTKEHRLEKELGVNGN